MAVKDIIKDHILFPLTTALLIAGGATVVQNRVEIAKHDERITRIEKLDASMTKLADKLDETRVTLATVQARQETSR